MEKERYKRNTEEEHLLEEDWNRELQARLGREFATRQQQQDQEHRDGKDGRYYQITP